MAKTLSYFSLIFLGGCKRPDNDHSTKGNLGTYRMDGGVPAGIFMRPSGSGDRQNNVTIRPKTRHGNSRMSGNGKEREESLVNRIRRLKKPVCEEGFPVRRGLSSAVLSVLFFGDARRLVTS